ncbi:hypothetical protein B0H13DRAFT_1870400 [Mycena leptocephala]|nr:hypothetical protein B0H13DRAFT_1870400 [Mycena leptocephala]
MSRITGLALNDVPHFRGPSPKHKIRQVVLPDRVLMGIMQSSRSPATLVNPRDATVEVFEVFLSLKASWSSLGQKRRREREAKENQKPEYSTEAQIPRRKVEAAEWRLETAPDCGRDNSSPLLFPGFNHLMISGVRRLVKFNSPTSTTFVITLTRVNFHSVFQMIPKLRFRRRFSEQRVVKSVEDRAEFKVPWVEQGRKSGEKTHSDIFLRGSVVQQGRMTAFYSNLVEAVILGPILGRLGWNFGRIGVGTSNFGGKPGRFCFRSPKEGLLLRFVQGNRYRSTKFLYGKHSDKVFKLGALGCNENEFWGLNKLDCPEPPQRGSEVMINKIDPDAPKSLGQMRAVRAMLWGHLERRCRSGELSAGGQNSGKWDLWAKQKICVKGKSNLDRGKRRVGMKYGCSSYSLANIHWRYALGGALDTMVASMMVVWDQREHDLTPQNQYIVRYPAYGRVNVQIREIGVAQYVAQIWTTGNHRRDLVRKSGNTDNFFYRGNFGDGDDGTVK